MDRLHLILGNKNYSSWSLRPWLCLTVGGVPFTEELVPFSLPGWKERIRAQNPAGQVPALIHEGAGSGRVVVWESLAICDYVARLHPEAGLWPAPRPALAFALSVCSEMHSGFRRLRESMPMNVRKSLPGRGRQPGVAEDIARIQAIWAEGRSRFGAEGPFLCGRFSVADAMYAPVVFRFATYAVELEPSAAAYRDHMLALPAMRAWAEAAAAEPWVEAHDELE
jgi:glutathione S-transferase